MPVPLLLYSGLFETFGIGSYAPYRVVGIGLVILCAGLFFVLARRRVGALWPFPRRSCCCSLARRRRLS